MWYWRNSSPPICYPLTVKCVQDLSFWWSSPALGWCKYATVPCFSCMYWHRLDSATALMVVLGPCAHQGLSWTCLCDTVGWTCVLLIALSLCLYASVSDWYLIKVSVTAETQRWNHNQGHHCVVLSLSFAMIMIILVLYCFLWQRKWEQDGGTENFAACPF